MSEHRMHFDNRLSEQMLSSVNFGRGTLVYRIGAEPDELPTDEDVVIFSCEATVKWVNDGLEFLAIDPYQIKLDPTKRVHQRIYNAVGELYAWQTMWNPEESAAVTESVEISWPGIDQYLKEK